MIYIDELKDFKLYKRPFLLPRNQSDKKKGGVCLLLTPNINSTIKLLNDKTIDKRYYASYYLEKDVSLYMNESTRYLEALPINEYVHVSDENVVNEGIYRHIKRNIIYNGYANDVRMVQSLINMNTIESANADTFCVNVHYPISVTVVGSVLTEEEITQNAMTIRGYSQFNTDKDYYSYCQEMIYEFLIKTLNPDVNEALCDAITMVLAKTFREHEDLIKDNKGFKGYYMLCQYIENLIENDPQGMDKLKKIIKKNKVGGSNKNAIQFAIKNTFEAAVIYEDGHLDPIAKLKRNIRYHANKGSKHITDKINRIIDRTLDSTVKAPNFTQGSDDPNLSNIDPPNINDIKSQIQSAASGQGSGAHPSKAAEETPEQPTSENTYQLDDEFYWLDENGLADYMQMENTITFFNEADTRNPQLYKILYKERLRNNKAIIPIYDKIRQECPDIKYTFLTYRRYKNKNLFVDLHYYNEVYFRNSIYKQKRGLKLYLNLLDKMINDPRLKEAGYTGKRCMIIPVQDWDLDPKTKMWLYDKDINPISLIYNLMLTDELKLKQVMGDIDVVFYAPTGYFKVNFAKADFNKNKQRFLAFIKKLRSGEVVEDDVRPNSDSAKVIANTIADELDANMHIKVSHLVGDANKEEPTAAQNKSGISYVASTDEDRKKEVAEKIKNAAETSNNTEEAKEKLDQDEDFKRMIATLDTQNNPMKMTLSPRRQQRLNDADKQILAKKINGKTVEQIMIAKEKYVKDEIKPADLPIDSINPEWHELRYANFANQYDLNDDVVTMIYNLQNKSYPISILDLTTEDTSTSEDYLITYTVKMENHEGKRFSIKFDVPIVVNNQYMMLRGNKKVISIQSFLAPITKTDDDTVQVISNYNKIFIRRFGGSTIGKSNVVTDRVIKTLKKNEFKGITVDWAACDSNLESYRLPIDYIDFASCIRSIDLPGVTLYFDLHHMLAEYKGEVDLSKGVPIGIRKNAKKELRIIYFNNDGMLSNMVRDILQDEIDGFRDKYNATTLASKYTYSKASILNTEIPLIVVMGYTEGLISVLDKGNFEYNMVEKLPAKFKANQADYHDYIKFSDGYLIYNLTYESSLLMNGLKECPTEMYSLGDINNRDMYLDFLDNFGGRLKADGIDNFYDCMLDPITKDVLEYYDMPTDYIKVLHYANATLADNAYFTHGNQTCRRWRKNEVIAGYVWKALSSSYGTYCTNQKHGRNMGMTIKRSAVIDYILLDPTSSDLSIINCLNEKESYDQVTTKGLSGMNSDRSYSVDKRAYDDSMANVLGMSTGFAATTGIARQATLNANISTGRGFVKTDATAKDFNSVNTLCMSEALTPFGTTRDDPFRSAMTFVQTTRHEMRTIKSDPLLITNGADQALPYLISDTFAFKAKDKGEVVDFVEDDYMIVKYNSGKSEYIDLKDNVEKNSSSGFYVTIQLGTKLRKGSKFKEGDILAYDKHSFSSTSGFTNNLSYDIGVLAKVALMDTDEGFEDSAIVSDALSEGMTSNIYKKKEINLDKNASIFNLVEAGTPVEEGDTILTIQSAFDEDDANQLLKKLSADETEISELGRVNIKSSVTGWIQSVEVARTVELDELSPSLKKLCKKYESDVNKHRDVAKKNGVEDTYKIGVTGKLDPTGRMKNCPDGVKITIYMGYNDKFSIGDKLVYWSANKGVCKDIFPKGKEPYSLDRPNEKIHTLVSIASINGRMVTSVQNVGIINRLLIEASRKAKDILGINYEINLLK